MPTSTDRIMSFNKKSISDIDVRGKRVLLRCDFNIPINRETGEITDARRIISTLPTITYLLDQGASVIACSHLGRPKGVWDKALSLRPVADRLSIMLSKLVKMSTDIVGEDSKALAASLRPGDIMMLENLRFDPREEKNDPEFARELASMADIFVSDAFGSVHRAHASTAGVTEYLPSVAGFLLERELRNIGRAVKDPVRPLVAVLGGSKISDKLGVIVNLLEIADTLIIGGGMAYTFIKAQGGDIGGSLCEDDKLEYALDMLKKSRESGTKLLLPYDSVIAASLDSEDTTVVESAQIPPDMMGLDIGPRATQEYIEELKNAGTVIWNGPMGVFEKAPFANGTRAVAEALADSSAVTIIGGGDSASAIRKFGFEGFVTHISTGGGATLEFLEGRVLPGIASLLDINAEFKVKAKKRSFVIAGNWKMNAPDVAEFGTQLLSPIPKGVTAVICPPAPFISLAAHSFKDTKIGAQDLSAHEKGAYTGEISAKQLHDAGADYVIIGHSERRAHHWETDSLVATKVRAALEKNLVPIICVGETGEQRKNGETNDVIMRQVKGAFYRLDTDGARSCVIAYEPVWAIGTGVSAEPADAEDGCRTARETLRDLFGGVADEICVLYGGSMTVANAPELLRQPNVDGGLIGGASLDADAFSDIIRTAAEIAAEV